MARHILAPFLLTFIVSRVLADEPRTPGVNRSKEVVATLTGYD